MYRGVTMEEIREQIPKVIHYCWFGRGEKPDVIKNCMKSWKEKCPDYEIIEWNEDNFDINYSQFTKDAYAEKNMLLFPTLQDCG